MSIALELINQAIANANTMRDNATSTMETALDRLHSPSTVYPGNFPLSLVDAGFDIGDVPEYGGEHYVEPEKEFGAAPGMDSIPPPSYGEAPENTAVKPTFEKPQVPSALAEFSADLPSLGDITVPPAPSALSSLDITPPELTQITVPVVPKVVLPEFMATAPDLNIQAPSDYAERFASDYAGMSVSMRGALNAEVDAQLAKMNPEYHAQMAKLEDKLSRFMEGGTALPVAVEQALFNRARDKTNGEYLKTRDTIFKEGAKRGFTIPAGAQFSALAQARQAAGDNNARAAMDIAVKQAELEQQNIQFAVTQSANLRGVILNSLASWFGSLIQLNGQSLEYARDTLQAAIALYDTLVKVAGARVEIYKAEASIYEVRLKAVLAVYDVYQAEIKGLEAQVNIDTARVSAFSAQANAYGALANAYKATIDGVVAKAQLEKLKVDIFGAEVQAYSAQVNAKQAEWQGFTAQVQGEAARIGAYETEVRAYGQEVQAHSTKVQAYNAEVQAITAKNEGAYKVFTAAVQAYTAQVSGASESAKAEIASFESTLHAYTAGVSAEEAKARLLIQQQDAILRATLAQYDVNSRVAIASMTSQNQYNVAAAQVAVSAGGIYGNMAGSAMAGVNALGADISTKNQG